jgi:hypothetical protein
VICTDGEFASENIVNVVDEHCKGSISMQWAVVPNIQICVSVVSVGDGVIVEGLRIVNRLSVIAQSQTDCLDSHVRLKIFLFKFLRGERGILVFIV